MNKLTVMKTAFFNSIKGWVRKNQKLGEGQEKPKTGDVAEPFRFGHVSEAKPLPQGVKPPPRFGKTALIIGRFQPFHLGHLKLVEIAAKNVDKLIIGIGSSQEGNTKENPFTADERRDMIKNSVNIKIPFEIIPIPDVNNDKIWISYVKKLVPEFHVVYTNGELERRLFKEAGIEVVSTKIFNRDQYSGTEIRRRMAHAEEWENLVPEGTVDVIKRIDGVERVKILHKL